MISNTMAGIEANKLSTQQTGEELEKERVIYSDIHSADMAVLKTRQADLDVATFILTFSKCKDVPASAMLQGGRRVSQSSALKMTSTGFKTCLNGTTGSASVNFADPTIEAAANKLTPAAQKLLVKLVMTERQFTVDELQADGGKVAASVDAEVFGSVAGLEMDDDRDDGQDEWHGDDEGSEDVDEEEGAGKLSLMSAMRRVKKKSACGLKRLSRLLIGRRACSRVMYARSRFATCRRSVPLVPSANWKSLITRAMNCSDGLCTFTCCTILGGDGTSGTAWT